MHLWVTPLHPFQFLFLPPNFSLSTFRYHPMSFPKIQIWACHFLLKNLHWLFTVSRIKSQLSSSPSWYGPPGVVHIKAHLIFHLFYGFAEVGMYLNWGRARALSRSSVFPQLFVGTSSTEHLCCLILWFVVCS